MPKGYRKLPRSTDGAAGSAGGSEGTTADAVGGEAPGAHHPHHQPWTCPSSPIARFGYRLAGQDPVTLGDLEGWALRRGGERFDTQSRQRSVLDRRHYSMAEQLRSESG